LIRTPSPNEALYFKPANDFVLCLHALEGVMLSSRFTLEQIVDSSVTSLSLHTANKLMSC